MRTELEMRWHDYKTKCFCLHIWGYIGKIMEKYFSFKPKNHQFNMTVTNWNFNYLLSELNSFKLELEISWEFYPIYSTSIQFNDNISTKCFSRDTHKKTRRATTTTIAAHFETLNMWSRFNTDSANHLSKAKFIAFLYFIFFFFSSLFSTSK